MLKLHRQIPSGTILLDIPSTKNALSRQVNAELLEAFFDFHQEQSVRAVILSSTGATFCSGVDLKEWQEVSEQPEPFDTWREIAEEFQELIEVMLRFPKPIVAAIDGPAIGMGMALALACDLVIASNKASFSAPAPKRGLVSGLVAPLLSFRCGASVAARLLLGAETINAAEAHRISLVHHLVPSEQVWVTAQATATRIATEAAESIQMTKRLLNEMIGESLMTHLSNGTAMMATACNTSAAQEGLLAFVKKRSPSF